MAIGGSSAGTRGWPRASGIAGAAAHGRRLGEVFPDLASARLDTAIAHALELGASGLVTHSLHPSIFPLRTQTGRKLLHNISIRPIGDRPHLGCLLQIVDVTVMAGRERILRERQNARYDAVVGGAPDAIVTLDVEGKIQLVNPAAAREFGYAPGELIGRSLAFLLEDADEWNRAFQDILDGGTLSRPIELTARRRSGAPSYLEASASRWTSEGRTFVTVILRDVNERRMAVDALRLLNQTLERRVAQSTADRNRMWTLSTDVMMVAGLDGTISSINPAWTHLLGWRESDLLGANVLDFVVADERPVLRAGLDALSRGTAPKLIELSMRTSDGASRRIEWSAVAADDLLQAVGRDVTAVREAEDALRKAEEALRHSQKMEAIGQLTGGIAHDFNNMLTAIIGSMEVLKRRIHAGRYEDVQRFMDGAIASANRAAGLTHRLLAFARRQPLDPKAVDVNQLIRGMEELLRRTLGEKIRPAIDLAPQLGAALTDASQLENAILNLAINARDAMPHGGTLTITTANEVVQVKERFGQEEIDAGDYTVVCVGDTGVGMSPATLEKVFEPFFTTKPIGQGTGLGLSMIYGFAKQSRGHVRVESTEGKGTTFRLYLPRYKGSVDTRPSCAGPRCGHRIGRDGAGRRGRFGGASHHFGCAARSRLRQRRGGRRPGRPAHADLQHADRPPDHRRRPARPERTPARGNRPAAPSRPQGPVRHGLRRACDRPCAVPRAGHGDGDEAFRPRRAGAADSRDAAQVSRRQGRQGGGIGLRTSRTAP